MCRNVHPLALVLLSALGCTGEDQGDPSAPTWHQDVAPLVIERCSGCHEEGGIGPFPLQTYEQARDFAPAMLASVEAGSMPPFLAQETEECQPRLPWKHDLRLSAEDKEMLRAWVDGGTPEGDPATAAPLQPPGVVQLERADVVLALPEPIEVEGTRDIHTCLVLDPGLAEDSYVIGRLITSGNEKVLHHVVSYMVEPGLDEDGTPQTKADVEAAIRAERGVGIGERFDCFGGLGLSTVATEILDAWAPGGLPNLAPPGSGQPLSKDALVILDIHYHPTGEGVEVDTDTALSLMLTQERPDLISQTILLGNFPGHFESEFGTAELLQQPGESEPAFFIPAGEPAHVEEMTWQWVLAPGFDLSIYGMGTHMHYVGRDMVVSLEPAGGEPECLIQTPAWDFNWQRGYLYDAEMADLPAMRHGDVLRMRCVYDNTMANPFLQRALGEQGLDAPVDVTLGEDTLDEMCLAALSIVYTNFD
jgi:hypothetical protein